MVLFKYGFVIQKTNQTSAAKLPDPSGSSIHSSVITAANTDVSEAMIEKQTEAPDTKRGRYHHYSKKKRAKIAKKATEFGITATVRHYALLYPTRDEIPISTIATWKPKYLKELKMHV